MTRRIPHVFINDLLSRINIVDIIYARISLKKQGKNYNACCPFHNEKKPSFTVSAEKQFYYCFGCGAHGNVIDFLMHYDSLNFIESIEELTAISGLTIPFTQGVICNKTEYHKRQILYKLMGVLSNFYQKTLNKPNNKHAWQYLEKRGLDAKIINYFSIGYAPAGWDSTLKNFSHDEASRTALNDAGIIIPNRNGRIYDLFRNRIIFPIRDRRGRVIAFGGRTLNNDIPKYINSPETDIFHKRRELFGLYEAHQHRDQLPCILIVEGYMDVVTLAQFGINYALASLGTNTTAEHIRLMFRNTDTVVYCYDGDNTGRKAAWRALETALPFLSDGRQLKFMFLPDGEDPDTLIRKEGHLKFVQRINQAEPMSSFLFNTLIPKVDLSTPDGRTKLSALALPLIKRIPGDTLRFYLRRFLGQKIGILDDNQLEKILPHIVNTESIYQQPQLKRTTMRTLIGLLLQNPSLASKVTSLESLRTYNLPGLPLFIEIVQTCLAYPDLTTGQLIELYRNNKYAKHLETLATWNHMVIKDMVHQTFLDTLKSLYNSILQCRQEKLIALDRTQGLNADKRRELWMLNLALAKKT
ncbi:DNA primase [Candidatus Profftia sp. (ex Adelges kitamiensis)]|uniref:DNA primase n=1 Tax=Candidatus Profftia sp. (ex Adelges kitamiensis) TaxID=2864218 RepID=UPI001CE36CD1|nr:DNA primase [Candidatus Profftia sp. (ex Adelges kitamiensis)]